MGKPSPFNGRPSSAKSPSPGSARKQQVSIRSFFGPGASVAPRSRKSPGSDSKPARLADSTVRATGKQDAAVPSSASTPVTPAQEENARGSAPDPARVLFGDGLERRTPARSGLSSRSQPRDTNNAFKAAGETRGLGTSVKRSQPEGAVLEKRLKRLRRRIVESDDESDGDDGVRAQIDDDDDDVEMSEEPRSTTAYDSASGSSNSENDDEPLFDAAARWSGKSTGRDGNNTPGVSRPRKEQAKGSDATDSSSGLHDFAFGSEVRMPGQAAQRKVLACIDLSGARTEEAGGWCDKNPWSVEVRDSKRRTPDHPDYDPTTLHVPEKVLEKMSPFQRQFWDLKRHYYNTMLFVKKGAFMEAYDIDADIVHRELGLNYTGGGRASMRCAGVPEGALNRHAARLIDLGYRVGIVAQTETANAADKRKASASRSSTQTSAVCHRSLVRILTKATVTDDELLRDHRARYVLALCESNVGKDSVADDVVVGVCHVDAASGRITVGEYADDARRSFTERLISTLRPPEILVPVRAKLSSRMQSLLRWTSTGATPVDIRYLDEDEFPPMTAPWLSEYVDKDSDAARKLSSEYLSLHELAACAFGAIATYLKELIIDAETLSMGNYTVLPEIVPKQDEHDLASTDSRTDSTSTDAGLPTALPRDASYDPSRSIGGGLSMDSATMANLEVLSNVVDGTERGALISVIDRASTAGGRRLLRQWISDPLTLSAAINDRLNAVEALHEVDAHELSSIRRLLMSSPDLERSLSRLHQYAVVADVAVMFDDSNAKKVKAFVKVLRGLESTITALGMLRDALPRTHGAQRLAWLLGEGKGVAEGARERLDYFLGGAFDLKLAESDGEMVPQAGASRTFDEAKTALDDVTDELEAELQHWQSVLGDRSIKFYHRGKLTYQLEVKVATLKRNTLPREFTPASENNSVKRFYTPKIQKLIKVHVDASETFAEAGMAVLRDIVSNFDADRKVWDSIVKSATEVDALIGLSIASHGDGSGPMVRPNVLPDDHPMAVLEAEDLRHPVLAAKAGASFVANDTYLGGSSETVALVTGSNCSGKSTLSRQVAVSVILAQVGCFVPAKTLKLRPFNSMFARAGSRDEIARGRSTFMVEMDEAAAIVNTATDRSLVIVDELCSGTTAQDAYAISHATLQRLISIGCLTIFCTHADGLAIDFRGLVGNYTMAADIDECTKKIFFLYKLVRGVTNQSRGVCCARVAGVPADVADDAERIADEFDTALSSNREVVLLSRFLQGLQRAGDEAAVAELKSIAEQVCSE